MCLGAWLLRAKNAERERRRQEQQAKEPQTPMDTPGVEGAASVSPEGDETSSSYTTNTSSPKSSEDLPVSTSVIPSSPSDTKPGKTPTSGPASTTPTSAEDDLPASTSAVPETLSQQDPPSADEAEAKKEEDEGEDKEEDKEER